MPRAGWCPRSSSNFLAPLTSRPTAPAAPPSSLPLHRAYSARKSPRTDWPSRRSSLLLRRNLSGDSTGTSDPAATPAGAPSIVFPSIVSLRDRFGLEGSGFSGDARSDRVLLAGLPTLVLAASPVSLVQVPDPRTPSGPAKLAVTVGDLSSEPVTVTVVSLDVSGPENAPAGGEKSLLTVAVRGSGNACRLRCAISLRKS